MPNRASYGWRRQQAAQITEQARDYVNPSANTEQYRWVPKALQRNLNTITIHNDSGTPFEAGEVVGLREFIQNQGQANGEPYSVAGIMQLGPVVYGRTITSDANLLDQERFGIALEYIDDGALGRVAVAGICVAKLEVDGVNAGANFARLQTNNRRQLFADVNGGPVKIIWDNTKPNGIGTAFAIVHIIGQTGRGSPTVYAELKANHDFTTADASINCTFVKYLEGTGPLLPNELCTARNSLAIFDGSQDDRMLCMVKTSVGPTTFEIFNKAC